MCDIPPQVHFPPQHLVSCIFKTGSRQKLTGDGCWHLCFSVCEEKILINQQQNQKRNIRNRMAHANKFRMIRRIVFIRGIFAKHFQSFRCSTLTFCPIIQSDFWQTAMTNGKHHHPPKKIVEFDANGIPSTFNKFKFENNIGMWSVRTTPTHARVHYFNALFERRKLCFVKSLNLAKRKPPQPSPMMGKSIQLNMDIKCKAGQTEKIMVAINRRKRRLFPYIWQMALIVLTPTNRIPFGSAANIHIAYNTRMRQCKKEGTRNIVNILKTFVFMFTPSINKWNLAYCRHINHSGVCCSIHKCIFFLCSFPLFSTLLACSSLSADPLVLLVPWQRHGHQTSFACGGLYWYFWHFIFIRQNLFISL